MGYGWVEIIGFFSGALSVGMMAPQIVKIVKHKRNVGVSFGMWFFTMLAFASWMGYALRFNSLSQLVTNITALLLALFLLTVMLRQNNNLTFTTVSILILAPAVFATTIYYVDIIILTIIFIIFDSARILQIRKSWVTFRNKTVSEVAISSHLLSIIACIGWITYGLITGLWVNVLIAAIVAVYGVIIVSLESLARLQRRKAVL
jgi:uncharacterized protein with PQ loop repeat